MKKAPEIFTGQGTVRFSGASVPATYVIEGDPARLRSGPLRLRGRIVVDPPTAAALFRASEGTLVLEGGVVLRAVMAAHTEGGCEVFVDLRV